MNIKLISAQEKQKIDQLFQHLYQNEVRGSCDLILFAFPREPGGRLTCIWGGEQLPSDHTIDLIEEWLLRAKTLP